jgi:hypothetical protein
MANAKSSDIDSNSQRQLIPEFLTRSHSLTYNPIRVRLDRAKKLHRQCGDTPAMRRVTAHRLCNLAQLYAN